MKPGGFSYLKLDRLELLAFGAIILIGLVHLPYPFGSDQALFTVGALKLRDGAILYRDFWDIKQPGIYGFYLVGGTLFGFHEVGIHLFELLYMSIFSLVLMKTLRSYFVNPSMAALIPLLTIGIYYGVSAHWHLTQLEALVGFPMFLSLWFASEAVNPGRGQVLRFFVSGFMGGIVLLFKFLFLPILAAFWLTIFFDAAVAKRERVLTTLARVGAPVVFGVAVPLLIVFGYFATKNILALLYWTFFEFPAQLMRDPPYINPVANGLTWLISNFVPLLLLSGVGIYVSMKKRRDRLLTANLVLWLILGLAVILLQKLSRWEYHYLLLFVPFGILSVKALDFLFEQMKARDRSVDFWKTRAAGAIGLLVIFSPVLNTLAKKSSDLARSGFALNRESRLIYQDGIGADNLGALSEVKFLSQPESMPGDIYVVGDPNFYLQAGRGQAVAMNGFGGVLFWLRDQSMRRRLTQQLEQARPVYVYINDYFGGLIVKTAPEITGFMSENYDVLRRSDRGIWYILKGAGDRSIVTTVGVQQ